MTFKDHLERRSYESEDAESLYTDFESVGWPDEDSLEPYLQVLKSMVCAYGEVDDLNNEWKLYKPAQGSAQTYEKVDQRHVSTLVKSAISPEVAKGTVQSRPNGLGFAYHHADGSTHIVDRLDKPLAGKDGKPVRYMSEPGKRGLQVHPMVRDKVTDPSVPLVVVEGTKQALAAVSALVGSRAAVVGINGIRGWAWNPGKDAGHKGSGTPLPDWGYIPLEGRIVYVVPDGDSETNPDVRKGVDALCDFLGSRGADVHRVTVPLVEDDPKTGLDDYLGSLPTAERTATLKRMLAEARDDSGDLFLDVNDLDSLPKPEPLITGILNRATIVFLSGKFGTYKTFVALSWAACVATGRSWSGHTVNEPGAVVYVAAEGHHGMRDRIRAWVEGVNGGNAISRDRLLITKKGLDPRNPKDMVTLRRTVEKVGASLVVFDTLHRCTPGYEENSNTEAGEIFGALQRLKDATGATVLVLHHTGHEGKRARGASSMEDDADDAFVIALKGDQEDRSESNTRVLEHRKSKEGESGMKRELIIRKSADSAYIDVDPLSEVSGPPATPTETLVGWLDRVGAPVASRREVTGWVKEQGFDYKARSDVWSAAVRIRREREAAKQEDIFG